MPEQGAGQQLLERRIQRRDAHADQTWGLFLRRLTSDGRLERSFAERAAVSVMHTLEQRLVLDEARDLEAQLPMRLKELLAGTERPLGDRPERFGVDEFVRRVAHDLEVDAPHAEAAIRAVFATLRTFVSDGELLQVEHQLPLDLRALWRLEA